MVHFSSCIGQNLAAARLEKMLFSSHTAAQNDAILGIRENEFGGSQQAPHIRPTVSHFSG